MKKKSLGRIRRGLKVAISRAIRFIKDVVGEEKQSIEHFYQQFA